MNMHTQDQIITFDHHFKKVSEKKVNDPNAGKKRESLKVTFNMPTSIDSESIEVRRILQESLTLYAKQLISDNGDDWAYVPKPEDITLEALYADITKPSQRGNRILTKSNIATWAAWISSTLMDNLGKSQAFAVTLTTLAEAKFIGLIGKPEHIKVITETLLNTQVIETLDSEDTSEVVASVHMALIDKLSEISEVKEAALDLDALM